MYRLDKVLANAGYGSRKEVKKIVKNKQIRVNGEIVMDSSVYVDPNKDEIYILDEKLDYREYVYIMLNKPTGVISAVVDSREKTVVDLLEDRDYFMAPHPVGRLDKDTVGLLILTNDGNMSHRVLSPRRHVMKKYYVRVNLKLEDKHIQAFKKGIVLEDKYLCKSAELDIITSGQEESEAYVTIYEGKFHQIKRMFEAIGGNVLYLQRVQFADIKLDINLKEGEYRYLTDEEIKILKSV